MAYIGRLHPLLVHFPIALVIAAALAEAVALITAKDSWRVLARSNVRAGAVFTALATIAGWRLAVGIGVEASQLLEWHRWLGIVTAAVTVVAALATSEASRSAAGMRIYRIALFAAGTLVSVTGHLGGLLVWGENFLRP
jgi:uncharacterized membrane protein